MSDWATERTEAYMWQCGDDWCDCVQPRIERITPNLEVGPPWIRRETLWAGTFVSQDAGYPDGVTYETLEDELRTACQEYGIEYAEKVQG